MWSYKVPRRTSLAMHAALRRVRLHRGGLAGSPSRARPRLAAPRGCTMRGCAGAADAGPSALPLAGIRVVELGGLAPGPFAGMILADFGADVVKVEGPAPGPPDVLSRGKRAVALDLKAEEDRARFLAMCDEADVCIDPFRPGVLEDLRLDPAELCRRNPALIVARLTGYGQNGPMAPRAGHDINYLAQAGALHLCGETPRLCPARADARAAARGHPHTPPAAHRSAGRRGSAHATGEPPGGLCRCVGGTGLRAARDPAA